MKHERLVVRNPYWGIWPTLGCAFMPLYAVLVFGVVQGVFGAAYGLDGWSDASLTLIIVVAFGAYLMWTMFWRSWQADEIRCFPETRKLFVRHGVLGKTRVYSMDHVRGVEILEIERQSKSGKYKRWVIAISLGDERVQLRNELGKQHAEAIAKRIAGMCGLGSAGGDPAYTSETS